MQSFNCILRILPANIFLLASEIAAYRTCSDLAMRAANKAHAVAEKEIAHISHAKNRFR